MKFIWVEGIKSIKVEFTDGTFIEFECNLWNRTGLDKDVYDPESDAPIATDIFKSYNLWWETQSLDTELYAKELYVKVVKTFQQELSADALNRTLYATIEKIIQLHPWEEFRKFYTDTVQLNFDVYVKEKLEPNDTSIDTTYFTEASKDLVVFSILIKSLMPIWGLYYYNYKLKLGSEFAMLYSMYLVRSETLSENPAWTKLETLVHTVAGKKIKANHGYSITNDIGSEEQPDLILTLILLKKVCNFDPMIVGDSIIRNVYALLRDRCDRITRGGPKNRNAANRDGDQLSVVDTYNLVKPQPPSVEVAVSYAVKYTAGLLGLHGKEKEIEDVMEAITYLKDETYHYQIMTMVVGPLLGGRNLLLLRKEKIHELLAICSVWLRENKLYTLSELLVCIPKEKDMNTISFGGSAQKPVPSVVQNQINEIYKWVYPRTPGDDLISSIIRYVNGFDYTFDRGELSNLQVELAEMLIYHNHAMRKLKEKVYD